jgi:hypothetical protein
MGGSLRRRISKVSHQAARRKRASAQGEGLIAGEHVPDRFGELSGEVDLGDLGAALATEAFFNRLVALGVERVVAGVRWLISG